MPAVRRKASEPVAPSETRIYLPGQSPEMDAWFFSFYIENHLDYFTYPDHAATDEQIRFMVYTEDNERYYPCSDRMFEAIMTRKQSAFMQRKYNESLQRILELIDRQIEDPWERAYLESLIINKYKHETRDEIMIPSRMEKRLMRIYLNRTHIEDPLMVEKAERNRRASAVLGLEALQQALNYIDPSTLQNPPDTLGEIKAQIAALELKRLLCLATAAELWTEDLSDRLTSEDFIGIFRRPLSGDAMPRLLDFLGFGKSAAKPRKMLWLADESGEVIMDLALIRFLITRGHKVIVAFKSGPLFTKTDIHDIAQDAVLQGALGNAVMIENPKLGKNDLLRTLRGDIPLLVLGDGTSENVNLLLTSTTFARTFKEVDVVVSRGTDQRRRFFDTHFQFTQDIYSITTDENGNPSIIHKPRHQAVIKFSHEDLENKAQKIIDQMRSAKARGMTVIFYSGIIGSIPGKIKVAKTIMSVFIEHLKNQSALTFIINPSEYYEPGMDADDLMYMWEIVQRSGMIDIWRFQTYEDIETAFQLMDKKIPPEWVGKDATYSTGCTKEMKIAQEVQQRHPEMQVIGPARERFMRRQEYGVGKMYDQRLAFMG